MPLRGFFVHHVSFVGAFFFAFVLLLWGATSFDLIGLPHFKHVLYLFAFCPSGASICVGAFIAGICDFVTFFESTNAFGN